MSHFCVLVIGDNLEEQLAPYAEDIEVEPYKDYCDVVRMRDSNQRIHENLTQKGEVAKLAEYPALDASDEEIVRRFAYSESVDRDEKGWYTWSTYNPKSKWDWYSIGGRYLGRLLVKEGAEAAVGGPGTFGNNPQRPNGVDQARIKDLDWEAMRGYARREAEKRFESVKQAAEGDQEARFRIWMDPEEIAAAVADPERWVNQKSVPLSCWAVVKDGEWLEKGKMGWFGMSANEASDLEWQQKLSEYLAHLDPETLITVVDCHI